MGGGHQGSARCLGVMGSSCGGGLGWRGSVGLGCQVSRVGVAG